jgi:hypothetical protein
MTSARLLAVVLLLCPLLSLAQEKQQAPISDPSFAGTGLARSTSRVTDSDMSKVFPGQGLEASPASSSSVGQPDVQHKADALAAAATRFLAAHPFDPNSQTVTLKVSPDGRILTWDLEESCYAIRSYVVARDDKDSDSTHRVGSSTCRPASRYHVRNADVPQSVEAH